MKVGSLVECIKEVNTKMGLYIAKFTNAKLPVRGEIYTVREILQEFDILYLEELDNRHVIGVE
jgi:hypothetical protein